MNKYKKLINNSIVFAIGNFGSKFISLFMVPLYTFVLNTKEYGQIDIMTNTVNLLIPFVTITLDQAVLRFLMDKTKKIQNRIIISTSLYSFFVIYILFLIFAIPIFSFYHLFDGFKLFFFCIVFLNSIQVILLQYARGIGLIKEYAINGIIQTVIFAIFNVLLLVIINLQIAGYFWSMVTSMLLSIVYIGFKTKILRNVRLKYFDKKLFKEMFYYSIPLIPNSTMWWIVSNSTRYLILLFLGVTANGLFAVATKIPAIISTITGVFTQAWQLSAYEEYESKNRSQYYSIIFKYYYQTLFIISSMLMIWILPFVRFALEKSFFDSWKIIPALILGTIYQTLAGFIGSIYTAAKNTKGVFTSSIIGAFIAILLDVPFIYFLGINGAGLGAVVGFFIMWLIRLFETRKMVYTKIEWNLFIMNNLVFLAQWVSLYFTHQSIINSLLVQSILILLILILNKSMVKKIFLILIKKTNQRRKK